LLFLYWEVGTIILERQNQEGWGSKIVEQLSTDLKKSFPKLKGFSRRNLLYMRQFAETYPDFKNVQAPLAQISWYHNLTLLQKCSDKRERLWYAKKALENGWSRNIMLAQIESGLHLREGKAVSNFNKQLPSPQSDLAQQMMKDPYILDFLNLTESAQEKDLENAIVQHITKFLLELGVGFAYVGRQFHLEVGGDDFYLDLLFYHLKLRCYIVVELKTTKFIPEYAGKLNFYLTALDEEVKSKEDNPSIGIILCKDKNNVTAEYALRDINKPIGISEFQLTQSIPENLKSNLPTVEDLERELNSKE